MKAHVTFLTTLTALLSEVILRNLILLAAMVVVLAAVPFASVWASEIIFTFTCHDIQYTPANTPGVGASCTGSSVCYSAARDSLSIISSTVTMEAWCARTGVFNEVDISSGSSLHIDSGLATAFSNDLPVATYWRGIGCDGDPPIVTQTRTFTNCDVDTSSFFGGGGDFFGDSWLGGDPGSGASDGCSYCSYNWMTDAQCGGPRDTRCSIFMMQ